MKTLPLSLLALLALPLGAPANTAGEAKDAKEFDEKVRPFLARHCVECHGTEKPKGDFRVENLAPNFADGNARERWLAVAKRIEAGEMPPKAKPRPPEGASRAMTDWITAQVSAADAARRAAHGRVVLRRLNRAEYQNTMRDLLGVDVDLTPLLPIDSAANGFDNVGEALHVSSFLMEKYLEAADKALSVAIANGPQPPTIKKRYHLKDERVVKVAEERVFLAKEDALVNFTSVPWQAITLSQFYPPDRGRYRFRISAYGYQSSDKPVIYRVDAGPLLMATKNHLVNYFDAPPNKPSVAEWVDHLEARSTIRIHPYGLAYSQTVHKIGADKYEGPGLAIEWVEVEGPLHDTWPPESHRRIFGDLPQHSLGNNRNRVEVVSKTPEADAERILRDFTRRAFRRTVTDDDLKPLLRLVKARLDEKRSFEEAVRVGLLGVLVSPDFLFLREKPGKLDDFALASRLSYFLWSTMPDAELLALAEQHKLSQPDVLRKQVERLLGDTKAAAFTENFVGQWLGLRA